ncbi:MAG: tryptophan synthase subunit alpha [Candidatus Omnitrophica bacterium]|nr:tryptophan synthase subunit alpha [Candidatus Omnitrophota bacterium]
MNRIDLKFKQLGNEKKKAFIAYITAGDPHLDITEQLVFAFERAGVDIIELGVPFSDPMADGPVIQAASERALKNHVSIKDILDLVKGIRRVSQVPIALMTYYNPVFHMGDEAFVVQASEAGVDGVIIPDLPPEEAGVLRKASLKNDFSTVFFMAPTTTDERLKKITAASTGFIYYVSLTGVTGVKVELSTAIAKDIQRARKVTDKPVCVGFGISTAQHVREAGRYADGVIVGSAIIKEMQKHLESKELVARTSVFVEGLVRALRKV